MPENLIIDGTPKTPFVFFDAESDELIAFVDLLLEFEKVQNKLF